MEVNQTSNSSIYLSDKKQKDPVKTLDKDAFLQIMIAQLRYQDPTSPMDSSKFIEEMAQFTTLEQITNLNSNMEKLYELQQFNQASVLMGSEVSLLNGKEQLTGIVQRVTMGEAGVKIWVNNMPYSIEQVLAVEGRASNGTEEILKLLTDTLKQPSGETSEGEPAADGENEQTESEQPTT